MYITSALAVAAAVAPIVAAHDGPSMPNVAGLNIKNLKARDIFANIRTRVDHTEVDHHPKRSVLKPRQGGTDGQCGAGLAKCSAGYCCSESGWCGQGNDYCFSPGCQYAYGPACPENATPAGADTSTVARTKAGSVEYGGNGIYSCVKEGMVAITYDDGPLQQYTAHVLDIFKSYNAKATFFMTGNNINKGQIDITPELSGVVQRAYNEGHQIASHTWTHLDLSAISSADRKTQMVKNEMALRNILGFFPSYMRPPYSSCTAESGCESDLAALGYHIVYFDVDTDDYNQDDPNKIQNSKNWFQGNITAGGATPAKNDWLSISHDIHQQTAYNLTDFMLSTITKLGYKAVTVGECLGDPEANWYRSSSGAAPTTTASATGTATSAAPTPSGKVTTDATCGGTNGYTCLGSQWGDCCSTAGWCGSTDAYCGTGCNPAFGTCGTTGNAASSSAPASSSTPAPSSVKPVSSSVAASSVKPASTSAAPPASTPKVSRDGTCGNAKNLTCKGSVWGQCCSSAGRCGSTKAVCGTGCQPGFGTCVNGQQQETPPGNTPGGNEGPKPCPPGFWGWLGGVLKKC
ncbi:glycoside hydrolase/deacetylase [Polyplosphaeria fusca]|uniref:Glycoside hydrolase/deacetylase n=1 Tax=Polyplosphaeria fusca TaxID=682080 RepID=A0A9P4R4X7_9PLEO|nr:glycoside hydrolase/deacetylase [Polyplosphaeria fusca]